MTDTPVRNRTFRVYARTIDPHYARTVEEPSFEAAAVAYVEDYDTVTVEGEEALNIIVRDLEDGHERCFRIDLETGEAAPCG